MSSCTKHSCFWRYLAVSQIGVRLSDFVAVTLESFSTGGGSDNQGEGVSPNSSIAGQRGPTLGFELAWHSYQIKINQMLVFFPTFQDLRKCIIFITCDPLLSRDKHQHSWLSWLHFICRFVMIHIFCARSLLVAGISTWELRHRQSPVKSAEVRIIFRAKTQLHQATSKS